MLLTTARFARAKAKNVLVQLESLAGTGHQLVWKRPRLAEKLEIYAFDPRVRQWVMYKETKKIRSLKN